MPNKSGEKSPASPPNSSARRDRLIPGRGRGPAKGAPNAGRPPSAVRMALREAFAARVGLAEALADNPRLTATERLKALDLMARYGLGTTRDVSVEDIRDRLTATLAAIRKLVPCPEAERLVAELRGIWT